MARDRTKQAINFCKTGYAPQSSPASRQLTSNIG